MKIVTAHQPNYLPGVSVLRKLAASDAVIWLDRVAYTQGGFINRNRLANGTWLTVPVDRSTMRGEIRDVRIADFNGWQRKHARTLRQEYGALDHYEERAGIVSTIENAWRLDGKLSTLNYACVEHLLANLQIEVEQHRQFDLVIEGQTISEKLADMVGLVGGDVYLSGPSGHRYLDPVPFRERKIEIRYFEHRGPNPSSVDAMFREGRLR